jgi:glycerophosphoryl diester phosphodiesterase
VGHRGDPALHPDNSLAGVVSGLGATGAVEVDVRLTTDGHLVLSHDDVFAGRSIVRSNLVDLLALDPRPSLLDEIMALPGRLDVEIKNLPGEEGFDPHAGAALLSASRARPTDLLTSFFWPDMDRVRQTAPRVATGLVVGEGGSIDDALQHAADRGHRAVVAEHTLVDTRICSLAQTRCVALVAWTVNSVDRFRELSEMGVAAIISDDPRSMSVRESDE